MDAEAVQLVNLSPIPELSEIELSTMLEQLSGLSDLNSEFTERNFEEILKEAEELIDKSSFCDSNNEKPVNGATSLLINPAKVYEENSDLKINDNKDELNGNKSNIISSESNPPEEISNSKDTSFLTIKDSNNSETQVQQYSQPMFSPTNSTNHIKSTIDSIKQFSSLMEKQFSQAKILSASSTINSQYASNKIAVKKEEAQKSRKNFDSCLCDKSKSPLQYPEKVKTKTFSPKENSLEAGGNHQPIKPLSCFERLYQRRPARFSGSNENLKVAEKKPKVNIKKKNLEHIKLTGNALPTKSSKNSKIKMKCESNEHKSQKHEKDFSVLKNFSSNNVDLENYFKEVEFKSLKAQNFNFELPKEKCDYISNLSEEDLGLSNTLNYSKNEEKLVIKLLKEIKDIKNQIKSASDPSSNQVCQNSTIENRKKDEKLWIDMECVDRKMFSESMNEDANDGINRLEQQFSMLKDKYDQQIQKLELQNAKLREALNNQKELSRFPTTPQKGCQNDTLACSNVGLQTDLKNFEISPNGSSSGAHEEYETSRGNVFEEHLIVPKDSPDHQHHEENVQITSTQKEAFSQTENDVRNVSIQCRNNEDSDFREFTSIKIDGTTISKEEVKQNFPLNAKQVENKENLLVTKKPFKSKPYPDAYVSQIMKLKKSTSEHEIQLMSTLKGLRAEASIKDKENRKLRAEIDVLKTQIKKLSKKKSEIIKKCNRGTQTIALGPITQRPYNSEIYEGISKFENENEELRVRIKALEDSFDLLKEKRINDLQSLHQVHEREMAKLVSKLETQSALTKHLHSLLINR